MMFDENSTSIARKTAIPVGDSGSALRVLFNKDKDKNNNILSLLNKRQGNSKQGPVKKKKTNTGVTLSVDQNKSDSLSFYLNEQKSILDAQHQQQCENLKKTHKEQIKSLQSGWTKEKSQMQAQIDSLIIRLQKAELLVTKANEEIDSLQNDCVKYSFLYQEAKDEMEEEKRAQTKKSSILARLQAEMM